MTAPLLLAAPAVLGTAAGAAVAGDTGPARPAWWVVAAWASVAVLAAATAASVWLAHRGRQTVLSRLRRRSDLAVLRAVFAPGGDASGAADPASGRARLAAVLARLVPHAFRDETVVARLAQAGYYAPDAALYYGAARVLAPVLAPLVVLLVSGAAGGSAAPMALGLGLMAGLFGPSALLDRRAGTRRTAVSVAIPDALDLMIVCLEAGVGVDAALVRVARELGPTHPVLAGELENVTRRVSAGLPREEALRTLVTRTGVEDLRAIVSTMVQAERLGTSLARVLRIHGEALRTRRKQLAEKKAAEASVKMVIPLVLFLLPAFFAIVLGPAVLSMISSFRGS